MTDAQRVVLVVVAVLALAVAFVFPPKVVYGNSGMRVPISICTGLHPSAFKLKSCRQLAMIDGVTLLGRLAALSLSGGAAFLLADRRSKKPG